MSDAKCPACGALPCENCGALDDTRMVATSSGDKVPLCPACAGDDDGGDVSAWTTGPPPTPGWYVIARGESLAGRPMVSFATVTAKDLGRWADVRWHIVLPEFPEASNNCSDGKCDDGACLSTAAQCSESAAAGGDRQMGTESAEDAGIIEHEVTTAATASATTGACLSTTAPSELGAPTVGRGLRGEAGRPDAAGALAKVVVPAPETPDRTGLEAVVAHGAPAADARETSDRPPGEPVTGVESRPTTETEER